MTNATLFSNLFLVVPSAPDSIVVERRNDTAIQVTWARPVEPNGIILGYLIHYIGTKNNTVIVR